MNLFNDDYDVSSNESLEFEKQAFNMNLASSVLLGYAAGADIGRRYDKYKQGNLDLKAQDFPNVEGSYYAQIDNIARNLKVLLSPVSVIFTIPNNSSSITLDVIEISEMDDRMKEAFKNKDKEFFKKLFLNNMMLQTTLAEQHNASKLLKNYNALNESVNGIKKKANEDIYGDVVDAAIFQDKFKNLGTSTQAVFEKIASNISEDINLYLKRPFNYSEIGDLPIYKTAKELQDKLLDMKYIKKNLKVGYVGNRVIFTVDNHVLAQMNTMNMDPESFKKFKQMDSQYFKNKFMKEGNKSGIVKKAYEVSNVQEVFRKSTIPAAIYLVLLTNKFGKEWIDYDTEFLIKAVEVEFNLSEPIAPIALDKIFMIQNVSKNLDCLKNAFLFEKACRIFNNKPISFSDYEYGLTIGEIINGLQILDALTPDNDIFDDLSEEVMTYITKSLVLSGCRCMYPDRKIISSELENKFFTTLNSDITYRWFTLNPSELQYQKVIQPLCISILDALRANGDKSPKAIDTTLNKMVTRFKIKNERVINLTRDNIVDNLALDIMLDSLEKDIQDIRVDLNL